MKLREFLELYAGDDVNMNLLSEDGEDYDTIPVDSTVASINAVDKKWLNGEVVYFDYHDDEFYVSVDTKHSAKSDIKSSRTTRRRAIKASETTDDLDTVYQVLREYADQEWTNPTTGWTGASTLYQRDLDDGAYLFSLVFGDNTSEPDEILYRPKAMADAKGKAMFTIYPYSGAPTFADNLEELRRALRKEYSYLRKV